MRDRTYTPPTPRAKYQVPQAELDQIREDAKHAQAVLENPYFLAYLTQAKQEILEIHAKQSLHNSSETSEKNGKQVTLHYSAKQEYTLLAGQYRFIEQILSDFEQTALRARQVKKLIESEEVDVLPEDDE